ncbi:MAG TPA: lipoyl synthase, partial [Vicinamibacteria bacterium]|nr:lipoyl synthase [Vicinamibacteria bacterium]
MSTPCPEGALPRPAWIRAKAPQGPGYERIRGLMRGLELHTVCEEARCPNLGECWSRGTATFMILGEVCTRACGFCAVKTGLPGQPPDPGEPRRVAEAVARMGLRHAVVTSVNRDDQPDGGASIFAATIREVRSRVPGCAVEVLIPDFKGCWDALAVVLEARPDVLNHNVETVPRLYRSARSGARFPRSLELLRRSKAAGLLTKSGVMVGLGEELGEVEETIRDIRSAGTDILTVGQYLRPSPQHLPVLRYYSPSEFDALRAFALDLGFAHVESGPLVRSSYHAESHRGARGGGAPSKGEAGP